jgi:outer membrane protein assembly factor BamB
MTVKWINRVICLALLAGIAAVTDAQRPTRWRGPSGNGVYPDQGLLKKWPAEGPRILWSYEQLGQGHSSAVVDRGFVYTSGMTEG